MKAAWDALGYRGTIFLQAVAIIGIVFFTALSCTELTGGTRGMNSFVATALAACLTYPYVSFRPVTFAVFWLAIVAWLLLRDRRLGERSSTVWFIIPITILLANIHLVVVMVPIWVTCLSAAALWEMHGQPEDRPERVRRARRYGLLLLGAALACLATPMFPGAARSAWDYQFHDVMVHSGFITEMQPVYSGLRGIITLLVVTGLLLWALCRRKKVRLGEWLWVLAGAALMLRLGRFAPMFAIIAAPLLAATLPPLNDAVLRSRFMRIVLICVVTMGLLKLALDFPRPSESLDAFLTKDDTVAYPTAAVRFVRKNITPRHHRLINEFTWGGYLGWRLGDRYQILLDGRTQVFPADFWQALFSGANNHKRKSSPGQMGTWRSCLRPGANSKSPCTSWDGEPSTRIRMRSCSSHLIPLRPSPIDCAHATGPICRECGASLA